MLLPELGFQLLCDPRERIDMGMVGCWETVRLSGKRIYLGLTEGQMDHGVLTLFVDEEDDAVTAAFEKALLGLWEAPRTPRPIESFLVRGMDEASGPVLLLAPITARILGQIRLMVGEPGERDFAPQIRVLGPSLVGGAGDVATLARKHATSQSTSCGALWLDFAWSVYRPAWRGP